MARDTEQVDADARQAEIYRNMTPADRLRQALRLTSQMRSLMDADIRAILAATAVDAAAIDEWVRRLGLEDHWAQVRPTRAGE